MEPHFFEYHIRKQQRERQVDQQRQADHGKRVQAGTQRDHAVYLPPEHILEYLSVIVQPFPYHGTVKTLSEKGINQRTRVYIRPKHAEMQNSPSKPAVDKNISADAVEVFMRLMRAFRFGIRSRDFLLFEQIFFHIVCTDML